MLKKYKKLPLILTGLAGVALLTTGFSAWVISGGISATQDSMVDITVGEVNDNRIKVTLSELDETLQFDAPSGGKGTHFSAGEGSNEDMVFGATATIAYNSETNDKTSIASLVSGLKFTLNYSETGSSYSTEYENCLTSEYIEAPLTIGKSFTYTTSNSWASNTTGDKTNWDNAGSYLKTNFVINNLTDAKTITVKFQFGYSWGSVFSYINPVNYSGDQLNTIVDALTTLRTNLNEKKDLFKLTVEPVLTNTQPSA